MLQVQCTQTATTATVGTIGEIYVASSSLEFNFLFLPMNINSEKPAREMRQISFSLNSVVRSIMPPSVNTPHLANLALGLVTHGAPNDGYAFQTCSDYSFNFRHKNHTAVAIINLFVFFKDRRCLMLSRDNAISQQLSVVNIKSQEKQKRFVPRSKGAKTQQ